MVSHHPAKFGNHCGSEDIAFLVAKEQTSTCSLKSAITDYF